MKCDLCGKRNAANRNQFCVECAEMLTRLVAFEQRDNIRERRAAELMAASPAYTAVPGRG